MSTPTFRMYYGAHVLCCTCSEAAPDWCRVKGTPFELIDLPLKVKDKHLKLLDAHPIPQQTKIH